MIFELIPYQELAVDRTVKRTLKAWDAWSEDDDKTAIVLSAPTGAGKTIIATAAIERLLLGGEGVPARHGLRVLWISDSPYLNEQTRDKMALASEYLVGDRLRIIDSLFDERVFPGGTVSFLNTQKLNAGATSYRKAGRRQYDLWETIENTAREHGDQFILIVDEAHRGTGRDSTSATVLARLINGGDELAFVAPVVLGISATPDRFQQIVQGRSIVPVNVSPDDVRESGLVKDRLVIAHPTEVQLADNTLLEMAVESLGEITNRWAEYCIANPDESTVLPALVLQVPVGNDVSALAKALDTIVEKNPTITDANIFHAFDTHAPVTAGKHTIAYRAPQAIQDDARVRVVVFKEALTTGWDCPRAEVMVSLRKAQDATYITQLIGRMVRTPLARRITDVDELNEVWLYLPHFDSRAVDQVVERLRTGDDAVTTEVVGEPVILRRNPTVPTDVWSALERLVTYTRPGNVPRNDVDRAIRLGMLLQGEGHVDGAVEAVRVAVVGALDALVVQNQKQIERLVADFESIDYRTQSVDWLSGEIVDATIGKRTTSLRNVEDLFASARRRLYDATGVWYWDHVQTAKGCDAYDAKLLVAAVAALPLVLEQTAAAARTVFNGWRQTFGAVMAGWTGAKRDQYERILTSSANPEPALIVAPSPRTVGKCDQTWPKHLIAASPRQPVRTDLYPSVENGWEAAVLELELGKDEIVAWYRNPRSGSSALTVPYRHGTDRWRLLAPDYLLFRRTPDGVVIDVVDPHRPDLGDTVQKWRALSNWAHDHGPGLGRVLAVIGQMTSAGLILRGVDLRSAPVHDRLKSMDDGDNVMNLFSDFGFILNV